MLNRSDAKTRISMEGVEKLLGEGFYHVLPYDFRAASESISTGVPLVLSGSDSVLAEEIRRLISRYTNRAYVPGPEQLGSRSEAHHKGGRLGRLFGR